MDRRTNLTDNDSEIEITPEMIEAGLCKFYSDRRFNSDSEIVSAIFMRMLDTLKKREFVFHER